MTVLEVDEHRAAVLALAAALASERVDVLGALGRVLAQDVCAAGPLPPWDCSAMDGFAVRALDVAAAAPGRPVVLDLVGEAAAGVPADAAVGPRSAVRIMTGAPVPIGADTVVRQEDTDWPSGSGRQVSVLRAPALAQDVRRAGDDVGAGDRVLAAGTDLGPAQLAAAVAAGARELVVRRRPRVAVLSTGAELVAPGGPLGPGQIHDSNSVLLAAAAVDAGADVVLRGAVPDKVGALCAVLAELDGEVDVVVTSGGVSVGDHDVVKAALAPRVPFVQVAMQPGKPQGAGRLPGGTPVVCLPGNPVSAFVSFEVFVRPLLRTMLGALAVDRRTVAGQVVDGWRSPAGKRQYVPVVLGGSSPDGSVQVRRATPGGSASHLVAGLGVADALAVVGPSVTEVRVGDVLEVLVTGGR